MHWMINDLHHTHSFYEIKIQPYIKNNILVAALQCFAMSLVSDLKPVKGYSLNIRGHPQTRISNYNEAGKIYVNFQMLSKGLDGLFFSVEAAPNIYLE